VPLAGIERQFFTQVVVEEEEVVIVVVVVVVVVEEEEVMVEEEVEEVVVVVGATAVPPLGILLFFFATARNLAPDVRPDGQPRPIGCGGSAGPHLRHSLHTSAALTASSIYILDE